MSRRIISTSLEAAGGGQPAEVDNYSNKLVKSIPSDIVGAWLAVDSAVRAGSVSPTQQNYIMWAAFCLGLPLTVAWTLRQAREAGKPPAWNQAVLSTIAFAVWVFAMPHSPFASLGVQPLYGTLALIGYAVLAGLFPIP